MFYVFCHMYLSENLHITLMYCRAGSQETVLETSTGVADQPAVIPAQDSLIGDLLSMDISAPTVPVPATSNVFSPPAVDLLGGGLDSLVSLI
jgi:AP-1 complex subunit beta-1